jgi:ArsR family transcriptional regulator
MDRAARPRPEPGAIAHQGPRTKGPHREPGVGDQRPAGRDAASCAARHAHPAKIARLRRRLPDARSGSALADTFKVLGDLTRVRMLNALARAELCVCDLAALVGLSESAVSHQLRLLRTMRVVRSRRAGRLVFYALDDAHIMELLEQGLRHVQETDPRAAGPADWRRVRAAAAAAGVRRSAAAPAGMTK